MNFPPRIGEYIFTRELSPKAVSPDYRFGLYANMQGQEGFCKLWTQAGPNKGERELANETAIFRALSSLDPVVQYSDIHIPRYLDSGATPTSRYLLVEYCPGEYLSETATKTELLANYQHIIEYFQLLSTKESFRAQVSARRTAWQLWFFYLIHLANALLLQPGLIGLGLLSLWPVSRGLWEMGWSQSNSLVHRDLGGYNNTLWQSNRVIVIDFQLGCLTHPLMEWANCIATRENDPEFLEVFFASDVWDKIDSVGSQRRIFLALVIYGVMINIGTRNSPTQPQSITLFRRLLHL